MPAVFWIACICTMTALFAFAIVLLFFDVTRNGLKRAFMRTTILSLIAGWIGLLPVRLTNSLSIPEGIIRSFYDMLDLLKLSVDITGAGAAAAEALGQGTLFPQLYTIVLSLLSILVPVVLLSSVISGLREIAQRYKVAILGLRRDVAYVFSSAGHSSATLAQDIISNAPNRPFVVFCNMTSGRWVDPAAEAIRSNNRGNVVFTANETLDTLSRLGRFKEVHCFILSGEHNANIEETAKLVRWARTLPIALPISGKPMSARQRHRLKKLEWNFYCLHSDPNDELLFDSLYKVDSEAKVNVRLLSKEEECVWNLLTAKPLYKSLAPAHAQTPQNLVVCVFGLGATGSTALRTAYWIGRCGSALQLHIVGIDKDIEAIESVFRAQSPAMLDETNPATGEPIVRFKAIEPNTDKMVEFVKGLPSDWGIYCIVAYEDSSSNLKCAIELRRLFLQRVAEDTIDSPAQPVIAAYMPSEEASRATEALVSDRNEPYNLIPFGKDKDVFSYENIVDSKWEKRALAMNAAYDECWVSRNDQARVTKPGLRGSSQVMSKPPIEAEYSASEIKKLSNRACVRHIPYKLWCVGLEDVFANGQFKKASLSNEQWLETLGVNAEQADTLFDDVAVAGGHRPERDDLRASLDHVREMTPIVSMLSDIEHDRWCAYYRSHGWKGLTIEEAKRLEEVGIIRNSGEHQSAILKRHCYICSTEELLERGAQLGEDPSRYDRAAIVELRRILTSDLLAST